MGTVHGWAAKTALARQPLTPTAGSSCKGHAQAAPLSKRRLGHSQGLGAKHQNVVGKQGQSLPSAPAGNLQAWVFLERQGVRVGDTGMGFQPSSFPAHKQRTPATPSHPHVAVGTLVAVGRAGTDDWAGPGFDLQSKPVFPPDHLILLHTILLQLEEKVKNSEAGAGAGGDARVSRSQSCPGSEQFSAQLHIYLGACRGVSGLLYPDVTLWQAVYFPNVLQIRES